MNNLYILKFRALFMPKPHSKSNFPRSCERRWVAHPQPHPYTTIGVHQFCGKNKKNYLLSNWIPLQHSTLRQSVHPDCSTFEPLVASKFFPAFPRVFPLDFCSFIGGSRSSPTYFQCLILLAPHLLFFTVSTWYSVAFGVFKVLYPPVSSGFPLGYFS